MVAGRIGIAHSARLFEGHILFEGPHPTLRATSLSLYPSASSSITGCQLTPLAAGRSIVFAYHLTGHTAQV